MNFSSISRLLAHTRKSDCSKATCKHCEEEFSSHNKLHEHVRQHHSQKSPAMIVRPEPHMPDTPPATPRSTSAIPTPSDKLVTMVKVPVACPPSPPLSPPRSPILSHRKPHASPEPYMTMDDLFAMFAGKRSRKSLDIIHNRMRSPRSPMPGQARITSYFKPAGQPNPASAKSPISDVFTSSPCPAPRPYLPANQVTGTPQHKHIAPDASSAYCWCCCHTGSPQRKRTMRFHT